MSTESFSLDDLLMELRYGSKEKEKRKEEIEESLLKAQKPEKIIDTLNSYEVQGLSNEVLKLKVKGYRNLYDYILKFYRIKKYYDISKGIDIELSQTLIDDMADVGDEYINDEVLLSQMPNGEMVLDVMFEKNNGFIPQIKTIELAKELIKRKKDDLLLNADIEVLRWEVVPGKSLFEMMVEHNFLPDIEFVDIDGKIPLTERKNILFEGIKDDKRVIDYLLESNLKLSFDLLAMPEKYWHDVTVACLKYQKYEALSQAPEEFFTQKIKLDNGDEVLLFRYLLNKGVKPEIWGEITNEDIISYKLFEARSFYEVASKCSTETLTKPFANTGLTLLDEIIIGELEHPRSIVVEKIDEKRKMVNFNVILRMLYSNNKVNDEVSLILAKHGLYCQPAVIEKELGIDKNFGIQKYLYNQTNIPVQAEYRDFIDNFRSYFADGSSDKDTIEDIISSFNRTVLTNEEESVRDLAAIMIYKDRHPSFKITNNPNSGSHFAYASSYDDGEINLDVKHDIDVLAHEWGHLIHEVYDGGQTPDNIKELMPYDFTYASNNKQEVHDLFNQMNSEAQELFADENVYQKFVEFIKRQKGSMEAYKNEIRNEYKSLIGTKQLLIETLKNDKISREIKKAMTSAFYDEKKDKFLADEYVNNYVTERLKSEFAKFKEVSFQKNNAEFLCYENFIDAYYGGALGRVSSEVRLKALKDGQVVRAIPFCTHDVDYFKYNGGSQFREMFANYVQLKKSPTGTEYIEKIKMKISPELIEALEKYYKNLGMEMIQSLH